MSIGDIELEVRFLVDMVSNYSVNEEGKSDGKSEINKLAVLFRMDDSFRGSGFAFLSSDCYETPIKSHKIKLTHGMDEEQSDTIYTFQLSNSYTGGSLHHKEWTPFTIKNVSLHDGFSHFISQKLITNHGLAKRAKNTLYLPSDSLLICTFFSVERRLIDDGKWRLLPYAYGYAEFPIKDLFHSRTLLTQVKNGRDSSIGQVEITLKRAIQNVFWVDTIPIKSIKHETISVGMEKSIDEICKRIVFSWKRWKDETFTYPKGSNMIMLNNIIDRCIDMYYPYNRMLLSERWESNSFYFQWLYLFALQRLVREHNWTEGSLSEMSPDFIAEKLVSEGLFEISMKWIISQMVSLSCTVFPYAKDFEYSKKYLMEGSDTYGAVGLCLSGDCEDSGLFCYKVYKTFVECELGSLPNGRKSPFFETLCRLQEYCKNTYIPVIVSGHVSADSASGKDRSQLERTAHLFSGLVEIGTFNSWLGKKKTHKEAHCDCPVILFEGTGINHGMDTRDDYVMWTYEEKRSLFDGSPLSDAMRFMDYHNLSDDYDPFYLYVASVAVEWSGESRVYVLSPTGENRYGIDYSTFMKGKNIQANLMPINERLVTEGLCSLGDYMKHISKKRSDKCKLIYNSELIFGKYHDTLFPKNYMDAFKTIPLAFDVLDEHEHNYHSRAVEVLRRAKLNMDKIIKENKISSLKNDINPKRKNRKSFVYYCRSDIVASDQFVKDFGNWLDTRMYWVDYVIQYGLEYVSDFMITLEIAE